MIALLLAFFVVATTTAVAIGETIKIGVSVALTGALAVECSPTDLDADRSSCPRCSASFST